MTVTRPDDRPFRREVREAVLGLGEGETLVLDAQVTGFVNAVDEDAWRVLLVLPRPRGETWELEPIDELEREVERRTDELATRHGVELEGSTYVTVTTNDSRPEDVPIDDTAEPEDDPAVAPPDGG